MSAEYALDALVDYDVEEDDPERLVPNPNWKEINQQRKKIKSEIEELERDYGLKNDKATRPTMRGFKTANSALGRKIKALEDQELELKNLYTQTAAKVPLKETLGNQTAYRLKKDAHHLLRWPGESPQKGPGA